MRKILFLFIVVITLFGCTSKEKKIDKLIKDDMFKTLYDFESYQPIETKIDSAFNSIYTDDSVLALAYLVKDYFDNLNICIEKAKKANETAEIWSDSYSSSGRRRFNEAKDESQENLDKAKEYFEKIKIACLEIKNINDTINSDFIGWKVTHRYRCKTKGGNFGLGNNLYIINRNLKKIDYSEDLDNEDIKKIKDYINQALEFDDEEEE